jgi:hypothetical protein|tara:strand:+ start:150 stop:311 length:162 start_codon:yes stop_codon:yes gene_type:complete
MIFWVNHDFDRQDAYDREGKAQEQENQNDEKHENGKNRLFFFFICIITFILIP